jgi:membrane protein implicated in regulation of membrane protease activity
VAGSIATVYGAGPGLATGIGFIPGLIMAVIAWFVAYFLFKEQANSSIRPGQVVGAMGTVVTVIQSGSLGEVNISVNGQIVPYTAISEDGESAFQVGTRVKVIRDLGDKVTVRRAL